MTTRPENVEPHTQTNPEELILKSERHPLESLFSLGYTESNILTVYDKDDIQLQVQFRTLTPTELRDVLEETERYSANSAQLITERLETLARAIIHINHMPLVLTQGERQEFFDKYKRNPSPLEMALIILKEKIKSLAIIDLLFEAYIEFTDQVSDAINEAKKKSKNS